MQIFFTNMIQTALPKSSFRKLLRYGRKSNRDFNQHAQFCFPTARQSCAHWAGLHATSTAKGNSQWADLRLAPPVHFSAL